MFYVVLTSDGKDISARYYLETEILVSALYILLLPIMIPDAIKPLFFLKARSQYKQFEITCI